jgi:NAD(P)-dependent dehydrogenase (short-subunit alcohol dehydrogenase family)
MTTTAEQLKGFHDHLGADIPLGRVGRPEEIARVAVFLASEDVSFVAGIELLVDGGVARI